ncbi:MAG: glycosyltransferase family 2 protein [Betaproteobacteria bacterium]|nr:glycosyltransferase family 2 protein [Betaproteobacteria bacterium]
MARVAVIIPARNCANFILLTLHYALRQDFKDLEIVLVNDGSTDNLLEVLEGIDHRVRIITQANAGMSAARNRGIRDSDSEYIALLDADDIWHPKQFPSGASRHRQTTTSVLGSSKRGTTRCR